jgi:hypothetical protein
MAASIGSVLTRFPVAPRLRRDKLGETASLQRVDLDRRQSGFAQGHLECSVIPPGRLEDEAGGLVWRGPGDQLGMTLAIIGELTGSSLGEEMRIEVFFRDIDADGDFGGDACYQVTHLFLSLACHAGLVPRYPFGP